jgi:hypothetical protein
MLLVAERLTPTSTPSHSNSKGYENRVQSTHVLPLFDTTGTTAEQPPAFVCVAKALTTATYSLRSTVFVKQGSQLNSGARFVCLTRCYCRSVFDDWSKGRASLHEKWETSPPWDAPRCQCLQAVTSHGKTLWPLVAPMWRFARRG